MVGLYFIGVIAYLMTTAVLPITKNNEWRTVIDVIAVASYLIGGLPLIWIALQEFGFVNKALDQIGKLKIHVICVALFLVFGHIAMIAGMVPMAISGGQSASLGRAVIGGLSMSTLSVLTLLPMVFAMVQKHAPITTASLYPEDEESEPS